MQQAQLYYDLPTIFVGLITIGVLGLLMDRLLLPAERRLTMAGAPMTSPTQHRRRSPFATSRAASS